MSDAERLMEGRAMTKDEISMAFRLLAMGRIGHDLQVQLAERLELVFERVLGVAPPEEVKEERVTMELPVVTMPPAPTPEPEPEPVAERPEPVVERRKPGPKPGFKKKAA